MVIAFAAAVVTSCGSTPNEVGGTQAVLVAYRQSWADVVAAGDPIKPDAAQLKTHRSGQALDVIVAVLRDYESRGVVYRGEVELHPKIVEFNGDSAKIRDCVFDHTQVVKPATNEVVKPAADHPIWASTTMQVVEGSWKATNFAPENQECTPEP